jgi:hypothetical protein
MDEVMPLELMKLADLAGFPVEVLTDSNINKLHKFALLVQQKALTQATIIPEGMKLVPKKATKEMIDAGMDWDVGQRHFLPEIYESMLSAAPELEPKGHD